MEEGSKHYPQRPGTRPPFFFEHDRQDGPMIDDKPSYGSWYRLYDSPVEAYNHGMQYQNEVGQWIHTTFLVPNVGPVARPESFSTFP
jgi:hypothetical protein